MPPNSCRPSSRDGEDSTFGALALLAFAEMVRKAFGKRSGQIDFQMSPEAGSLPLLDVMEHAFCA